MYKHTRLPYTEPTKKSKNNNYDTLLSVSFRHCLRPLPNQGSA